MASEKQTVYLVIFPNIHEEIKLEFAAYYNTFNMESTTTPAFCCYCTHLSEERADRALLPSRRLHYQSWPNVRSSLPVLKRFPGPHPLVVGWHQITGEVVAWKNVISRCPSMAPNKQNLVMGRLGNHTNGIHGRFGGW